MTVRFTPQARDDLDAILRYIDERSPQGAERVKRALHRTVELIGQYPQSGRVIGMESVRALPAGRYPYIVYWIAEGGDAVIVHIRDGRRRPWKTENVDPD